MHRGLTAAASAVLLVASCCEVVWAADEADVSSPSPTPVVVASPPPTPDPLGDFTHIPGTGEPSGLDWHVVTDPVLDRRSWLSRITAWEGGFATMEERRGRDRRYAIWLSSDGRAWERSSLPASVKQVWWLRPLRRGLVLAAQRQRGHSDDAFELDMWRSPDGTAWRRVGSVGASLPARLPDPWHLWPVELIATDDRMVLLARITYSVGTGGRVTDGIRFLSAVDGERAHRETSLRPDRIWGWTSRHGSRWVRRPVMGIVAGNGSGSIDLAIPVAGETMARQVDGRASLLSSQDGLRWRVAAPLPNHFEWGGSEGLLWADEAPLLLSDSSKGPYGCGNRLGVWRMEEVGTWTEVLDRKPAFVHGAAADGRWVILSGRSWCAGEWGWLLVSADGGRSWDPELSWTGPRGSCFSEVAIRDGMAVVLGCRHGRSRAGDPPMWWAKLPTIQADHADGSAAVMASSP